VIIRATGTERQFEAFRYLWAKYVRGFNQRDHCARCLVGSFSKVVKPTMGPGDHVLDAPATDWEYFYLCGVTRHWHTNLHLAARRSQGNVARVTAFNGAIFEIPSFEAIPINPLPVGFRGMNAYFTTCRNWQFGVQQYAPVTEAERIREGTWQT
jgi:hypothetical protein